MASVNFTDFSLEPANVNNFLVGYDRAGTREIRMTIGSLISLVPTNYLNKNGDVVIGKLRSNQTLPSLFTSPTEFVTKQYIDFVIADYLTKNEFTAFQTTLQITLSQLATKNHAQRHAIGGEDVISPQSIGAANIVHTHTVNDIIDLSLDWSAITNKPTVFPPQGHTHPTSQIINFNSAVISAAPVQSVAGRFGVITLSAADIVDLDSSNWGYQGTDIKALTGNWQNTYTTVQSNSSNWGNGGTGGINWSSPPLSANSSGAPGDIAYSSNYLYICVEPNTWRRTILATWD